MTKKLFLTVISVLICLLIGYGAGYLVGHNTTRKNYQEMISRARKMLPVNQDIRSMVGDVREVGDGYFVIEPINLAVNPFDGDPPHYRRVIIKEGVKISRVVLKSQAEFEKEMVEFRKRYPLGSGVSANGSQIAIPRPTMELVVASNEIKVGDIAHVVAGESIALSSQIIPIQVNIQGAEPAP